MCHIRQLFGRYFVTNIKPLYHTPKIVKINDPVKLALDRAHNIYPTIDSGRDMKVMQQIGKLHEFLMMNQPGWTKCNEYPADIRTNDFKIFIELKNSQTTMNSSSKKTVINNLIKIKQQFPTSLVCLGIVNGTSNNIKIIDCDHDIKCYSGEALAELVYGDPKMFLKIADIIREYFESEKR